MSVLIPRIILWLTVAALVAVGGTVAMASNAPGSAVSISIENGLLTLKLKEASLLDVLNQIVDKTGIEVEIRTELQPTISADISGVPLDKGLKRLLNNYSYITVYGPQASGTDSSGIQKIVIYNRSGQAGSRSDHQTLSASPKKQLPGARRKPRQPEPDPTLDELASKLDSKDPEIREEAVSDAAYHYEDKSLELLGKALLNDENTDVRVTAAEEIGDLENENGIRALADAVKDPSEEVREAVVEALGEIGGRNAVPALRSALNDENEDIREAAADLIEEIQEEDE